MHYLVHGVWYLSQLAHLVGNLYELTIPWTLKTTNF